MSDSDDPCDDVVGTNLPGWIKGTVGTQILNYNRKTNQEIDIQTLGCALSMIEAKANRSLFS